MEKLPGKRAEEIYLPDFLAEVSDRELWIEDP